MSDIGFNLDGVISLLVAGALSVLLAIGLFIVALYAWAGAVRTEEPVRHQPLFPHLVGMTISLCCTVVITAIPILSDSTPELKPLNPLLDHWLLLRLPLSIAPWIISAILGKQRRRVR